MHSIVGIYLQDKYNEFTNWHVGVLHCTCSGYFSEMHIWILFT